MFDAVPVPGAVLNDPALVVESGVSG